MRDQPIWHIPQAGELQPQRRRLPSHGRAAGTEECATIAGTEAANINEDTYLCLAPTEFDQSREVNTIVAGDCLIFEDIPEEKKETMATP